MVLFVPRSERVRRVFWPAVGLLVALACSSDGANGAEPTAQQRPAPAPLPRCALIDLDRSPLTAVLEAKLLEEIEAVWLEREAIDQVIDEQKVQVLFGPESGAGRAALGKLLKADLLVLVRNAAALPANESSAAEKPVPAVELAVTETRRGVRICMRAVPRSADAEADADQLLALVREAMAKHAERATEIYAVPPFASQDLGFQHDYARGAYAKLVEQMLLEQPGALVVELAEAQSLAKEVALTDAGARLERDAPWYLLGGYRNHGQADDRRVDLSLKLMRGEITLDQRAQPGVLPDRVAATLRRLVADLLATAGGVKQAAADPAAEVKALNRREKLLLRLGQWSDALALAEASLLLQPDQLEMRHDAIVSLTSLSRQNWNTVLVDLRRKRMAVANQRRGLEHLELFARGGGLPETYDRDGAGGFPTRLSGATINDLENANYTVEHNQLIAELRQVRREFLMRIIPLAARANWKRHQALLYQLLLPLTIDEQFDLIARLVSQTLDAPETKQRVINYAREARLGSSGKTLTDRQRAMRALYDLLKKIDDNDVQAAVRQLVHDDDSYVKQEALRASMAAAARSADAEARAKAPPNAGARPVEFTWNSGPNEGGRLTSFRGCLPAGDGVDVVWHASGLYLMKQPGQLKRVWQGESDYGFDMVVGNTVQAHVCFDGRFVWASAASHRANPPRLLVIEPVSEKVWEFTEADGLPLSTPVLTGNNLKHFIAMAPLAPGKVCLAGSFGQTWLATATFAPPGKKSVRVFHEARAAFDRDSQEQPHGVDVAFHPTYMLTLLDSSNAGPQPASGLIVGRGELMAEYPPLRIDPTTLSVSAVITGAQLNMYMSSSWARSDVHRGALYFVGSGPGSLPTLRRYALPELKAEPALIDCPAGFVAFTGDRLHIIGRDWWTGHADGKPLRCVAEALPWSFTSGFFMRGRPPEPPETPEVPRLLAIYHSSHYGLLVKRAWSALNKEALYDVSGLLDMAATQPSATEPQPGSPKKSAK